MVEKDNEKFKEELIEYKYEVEVRSAFDDYNKRFEFVNDVSRNF